MELNDLYDIAERENIKIYNWHIENSNGAFINVANINAIALNYDEINTHLQEKETLAEELGHYYMDATYSLYSNDTILMAKQEYRARKWSFKTLAPVSKIKELVRNGYTMLNEISEELDISERFLNLAIQYYKENGLLEELQCN